MLTLLGSCVALALSAQAQSADSVRLKIGDPAPALEVAKWVKGEGVQKFDPGHIYVVEFWATWCGPCIGGMPHLSELSRKYRNQEVTVASISVLERGENTLPKVEHFVDSMGTKMDYIVGADSGYMVKNWLHAVGQRGIPFSILVDGVGRVAWMGDPKRLDPVIPKVLSGQWDIAAEARRVKEAKRIAALDGNVIPVLNPFMGRPGNPKGALAEIAKIVAKTPELRYAPYVGHFTFCSLAKSNPVEAVTFGKAWLAYAAANGEDPKWKSVTDCVRPDMEGTKELYEFAAESYQAQLDNYPWSMSFAQTYASMAELYSKAKDDDKAVDYAQKAIAAAKNTKNFPAAELAKLEASYEAYNAARKRLNQL